LHNRKLDFILALIELIEEQNMRFFTFLFILLLCTGAASAKTKYYVVDGDSLNFGKQRIRLSGIDAPEYDQECYRAKRTRYACGVKSYQYLKKMVNSGRVSCVEHSLDTYKRSLCTCYVDLADGRGLNINEEMVKAGWAVSYRDEETEYQDAENYAKQNHLGVWQGKFMKPQLYRILNK